MAKKKVTKAHPVAEGIEVVMRTMYEVMVTATPIVVLFSLHEIVRFLDGSRTMMPILMGYCVLLFIIKTVYYLPVLIVTLKFKWYSFVQYVTNLGLYGTTFAIALRAYQTGDVVSLQLLSPAFFLIAHHVFRTIYQRLTR